MLPVPPRNTELGPRVLQRTGHKQVICPQKSSKESIRVHYQKDILDIEMMKRFWPVTTLSCLRIELRTRNKARSVQLAIPFCSSSMFRKRQLIIEIAMLFNEILVIISMRKLVQTIRSYSIPWISWYSQKDP